MENTPQEEFAPLTHQVAGCHSGTPSNILVSKSGQIMKPYKPKSNVSFDPNIDPKSIVEPTDLLPITLNELDFYRKIHDSEEDDYVGLRKISSKFFGSKMINGQDHLLLGDFTCGMKFPCVMDVKVGRERYYPGRSAAKAKNDKIKYPCLQKYGFCIAGIKMCDPSSGEVSVHSMPMVTRQFTSEQVAENIKKFVYFGDEKGSHLRSKILEGVKNIYSWTLSQKSIVLRGSSLLLVYDAAALVVPQGQEENGNPEVNLGARVGMIDFAHAFHSLGKPDSNYVTGMKNLVHLLQTGELPSV